MKQQRLIEPLFFLFFAVFFLIIALECYKQQNKINKPTIKDILKFKESLE